MTAVKAIGFLIKIVGLGLVLTATWMWEGFILALGAALFLGLAFLAIIGMVMDPHREERDPYAMDIQRRHETLSQGQHATPP